MNYVSTVIGLVKPKGLLEVIHSLWWSTCIPMVTFNNLLSILFENGKSRQNNSLEIPNECTSFLKHLNEVPQTGEPKTIEI